MDAWHLETINKYFLTKISDFVTNNEDKLTTEFIKFLFLNNIDENMMRKKTCNTHLNI